MSWKHFKIEEFKCPCCGVVKIDHKLIDILDKIREEDCPMPFKITSGYRCPTYNTTLGGGPAHPRGIACDIYVNSSTDRYHMLKAFTKYFTRIGVGYNFIHVDLGDVGGGALGRGNGLPDPVIWTYK